MDQRLVKSPDAKLHFDFHRRASYRLTFESNFNQGVSEPMSKEHARTESYLRKAVDLDPDNARSQFQLGICLRRQDKLAE